jgi:hypothetical protein
MSHLKHDPIPEDGRESTIEVVIEDPTAGSRSRLQEQHHGSDSRAAMRLRREPLPSGPVEGRSTLDAEARRVLAESAGADVTSLLSDRNTVY